MDATTDKNIDDLIESLRLTQVDPARQPYIANFVETTSATGDYNCLAFCLGVRAWLGLDGPGGAEGHLLDLGFRPVETPPEGGTVLALYDKPTGRPHVAKRLGGNLYESKCGDGIRIALRQPGAWPTFGPLQGLWFIDEATRLRTVGRLETETLGGFLVDGPLEPVLDVVQGGGDRVGEVLARLEELLPLG